MKKLLTLILVCSLIAAVSLGWVGYQITRPVDRSDWVFIRKNELYSNIKHSLNSKFNHPWLFNKLAEQMNLASHIYPGRYRITSGMDMLDVIRMLRSGKSVPVTIRIKSEWTREQAISELSDSLSCSAQDIQLALTSLANTDSAFSEESVWSIFIADTYFFNWYTEGEDLVNRMQREFKDVFKKHSKTPLNLTPAEVCILATIVQGETYRKDEMPIVAGLYLNRLKINMPLQADPTIKFALKRDSVRRITHRDLEVNSPYNTYKRIGLPPGPISFPTQQAIESILNHADHNYLYMCAREDLSGYHRFAANYSTHLRNARLYQRALNRQRVYR
jgi:UPF0755 protein